jgi:hypothetical protein
LLSKAARSVLEPHRDGWMPVLAMGHGRFIALPLQLSPRLADRVPGRLAISASSSSISPSKKLVGTLLVVDTRPHAARRPRCPLFSRPGWQGLVISDISSSEARRIEGVCR